MLSDKTNLIKGVICLFSAAAFIVALLFPFNTGFTFLSILLTCEILLLTETGWESSKYLSFRYSILKIE